MNPKELLLYALGLCAGKTLVSFFEKMRIDANDLEISVEGHEPESSGEGGETFTHIDEVFSIKADEKKRGQITRAVQLTDEKYCKVGSLMRKAGIPVRVVLLVNGSLVEIEEVP